MHILAVVPDRKPVESKQAVVSPVVSFASSTAWYSVFIPFHFLFDNTSTHQKIFFNPHPIQME